MFMVIFQKFSLLEHYMTKSNNCHLVLDFCPDFVFSLLIISDNHNILLAVICSHDNLTYWSLSEKYTGFFCYLFLTFLEHKIVDKLDKIIHQFNYSSGVAEWLKADVDFIEKIDEQQTVKKTMKLSYLLKRKKKQLVSKKWKSGKYLHYEFFSKKQKVSLT